MGNLSDCTNLSSGRLAGPPAACIWLRGSVTYCWPEWVTWAQFSVSNSSQKWTPWTDHRNRKSTWKDDFSQSSPPLFLPVLAKLKLAKRCSLHFNHSSAIADVFEFIFTSMFSKACRGQMSCWGKLHGTRMAHIPRRRQREITGLTGVKLSCCHSLNCKVYGVHSN